MTGNRQPSVMPYVAGILALSLGVGWMTRSFVGDWGAIAVSAAIALSINYAIFSPIDGASIWSGPAFFAERIKIELSRSRPHSLIACNDLDARLRVASSPPLILDFRHRSDFDQGHIAGAVLSNPLDLGAARVAELVALNRPIVTACYYGYFTPVASVKLARAGAHVDELAGGMEAWKERGLPMVKSDSSSFPSSSSTSGAHRKLPIFMDAHSTTPVDPAVLDAMLPFLRADFGNAGSHHRFGDVARDAVDRARRQVADAIGARPSEIVFTSGATESNNLAIKGVVDASPSRRTHVVTSAIEHPAVLDVCRRCADVTVLPVTPDGRVQLEALQSALTDATVLVSIMAANNEVGTVQNLREIGRICRARGILFHTDATQAIGRIEIDVDEQCIDLLSISAHKIYGPKGVGALFVRSGIAQRLRSQQDGGGQEGGLRSGTHNVPSIVGLGEAIALAAVCRVSESRRVARMRDELQHRITSALGGVSVTGSEEHRLAGNLHVVVDGIQSSQALLVELADCVAVSTGSACSAAGKKSSHVMLALGINEKRASCAVRFGIGRFNTDAHIDTVATAFVDAVKRLRRHS